MAAIRHRDTQPELRVRQLLHALGYRFRVHQKLPGRPDVVFSRRRKIIFVHGCFWHMHDCPKGQVKPDKNAQFWADKRAGNIERDERALIALRGAGWDVVVIWACETDAVEALTARLTTFLGPTRLPRPRGTPRVAGSRVSRVRSAR